MSDTEKKRSFVAEELGDKDVTDVPGIGEATGKALKERGYKKAFQLFGMYLALNKDPVKFKQWLKDQCNAKENHQDLCYDALKEWDEQRFR